MWEVEVTKSKKSGWVQYHDANGGSLRIEPTLPREAYQQERTAAYSRAIATWNAVDGSKRHRIAVVRPITVDDSPPEAPP